MINDQLTSKERIDQETTLHPLDLAITALGQASKVDAWTAFRESVAAYARIPNKANALKVEATVLALREQRLQANGSSAAHLAEN